ncbi:MAG: endonuclease [Paludibacteraceae bacterium]|nr:endonuclease [Paludibacteraceae bacterium]
MRNTILFCFLLLSTAIMAESMPQGYYDQINGKSDATLKGTLKSIIRNHTVIPYGDGSWNVFYYADRDTVTGLCMDMYCDDWKPLNSPGDKAAGCNVEHSFAKSWWGGAENDAYKDCYHLNPSNSTANGSRSNYPLGVPVKDFKDPSVTGSLKVGKRTHATLGDHFVFEPKDEYKGDFARAYFYMATCYGKDLNGNIDPVCTKYKGWRLDNKDVGSMFAMQNDTYLEFQDWEIEVLLAWHRLDPVSGKELQRMNAVSNFQHNRNPFIEYPCLAEYIWGNRKGQAVNLAQLRRTTDGSWLSLTDSMMLTGCQCEFTEPTLYTTISSITFPQQIVGETATDNFLLTGAKLTDDITLTITGKDADAFVVVPTIIAAAEANGDSTIMVSFSSTEEGSYSATLTISSKGANDVNIALKGVATTECSIAWLVNDKIYTDGQPSNKVAKGAKPNAIPSEPAAFDAQSPVFMGWSQHSIEGTTDVRPADLFDKVEDAPQITEDATFYAVFAHEEKVGSDTPVTMTWNTPSATGWTAKGMVDKSGYSIFASGASLTSPSVDLSTLVSVTVNLRTYGGKQFNVLDISANGAKIGSVTASNTTLSNYTWTNTDKLSGMASLEFASTTSTNQYGPAASSISIKASAMKYVYTRYITHEVGSGIPLIKNTNHTEKILYNGQLLIQKGNHLYNSLGQTIK